MRTSVTSRNPAIRILIVDDHPILRKGLVELFEEQSDLVVAGQAGTIAQALAAASAGKPDVAVVGLQTHARRPLSSRATVRSRTSRPYLARAGPRHSRNRKDARTVSEDDREPRGAPQGETWCAQRSGAGATGGQLDGRPATAATRNALPPPALIALLAGPLRVAHLGRPPTPRHTQATAERSAKNRQNCRLRYPPFE